MKIHNVEQGSLEWLRARAGIPTASEFDSILTPEFKIRTGEAPKSYLARKVAESWLGEPIMDFAGNFSTEQGQILEKETIPWYEFSRGVTVERVGLCLTDDGRAGCSPDGLLGDDCGLEIKCPHADTHVAYLLAGELPKKYAAQVHGSMFVTGRPRWRFLSYRRGFPAFEIVVERDEAIQARIGEALQKFLAEFDEAMKQLKAKE